MNRCDECGGETENEFRACKGACASERYQGNDLVDLDTKGIISCNCCESCRNKCLDSFIEQIKEEEKITDGKNPGSL